MTPIETSTQTQVHPDAGGFSMRQYTNYGLLCLFFISQARGCESQRVTQANAERLDRIEAQNREIRALLEQRPAK